MFFKNVQLCHLNDHYTYSVGKDKIYFNIRNSNKDQ